MLASQPLEELLRLAGADLDLAGSDSNVVSRLRSRRRAANDRAVLEAKRTEVPGTGDRPRSHLALVQRTASVAAPMCQGVRHAGYSLQEDVRSLHDHSLGLSFGQCIVVGHL